MPDDPEVTTALAETTQPEAEVVDLNQHRLQRLVDAGAISEIDLLRLRLDIVTIYAIPDAVAGLMNAHYEHALTNLVDQAESTLNRKILTDGVVPGA
jgi:hypothetical protein